MESTSRFLSGFLPRLLANSGSLNLSRGSIWVTWEEWTRGACQLKGVHPEPRAGRLPTPTLILVAGCGAPGSRGGRGGGLSAEKRTYSWSSCLVRTSYVFQVCPEEPPPPRSREVASARGLQLAFSWAAVGGKDRLPQVVCPDSLGHQSLVPRFPGGPERQHPRLRVSGPGGRDPSNCPGIYVDRFPQSRLTVTLQPNHPSGLSWSEESLFFSESTWSRLLPLSISSFGKRLGNDCGLFLPHTLTSACSSFDLDLDPNGADWLPQP